MRTTVEKAKGLSNVNWTYLICFSVPRLSRGLGGVMMDSFRSLLDPGSGTALSPFSSSSSSSQEAFCWLWRGGWGLVGWGASGSELSWELAWLRFPDDPKRLLSTGLKGGRHQSIKPWLWRVQCHKLSSSMQLWTLIYWKGLCQNCWCKQGFIIYFILFI